MLANLLSQHRPDAGFQFVERDYFDALAEQQQDSWWGSHTRAGLRRLERRACVVRETLAALDAPRVLEIGCGTGAFTEALLRTVPGLRLWGCDISAKSLAIARRRCAAFDGVTFEMVDLLSGLPQAAPFDVVLGNSVVHHLHLPAFLPRLVALVRPGGRLLFFEPNMLNPHIAVEKNVRFIGRLLQNTPNETAFFRRGLSRSLAAAGLVDVSVTPFDFLHPLTPGPMVGMVEHVGRVLERTPMVREIAGSLIIRATRPLSESSCSGIA